MVKAILKGWDLWLAVAFAVFFSFCNACTGYLYSYNSTATVYFAVFSAGTFVYIKLLVELSKDKEFSLYLNRLGIERKFWYLIIFWYLLTISIWIFRSTGWKFAVIFVEFYSIFYTLSLYHIVSLLPYYRKRYREIYPERRER